MDLTWCTFRRFGGCSEDLVEFLETCRTSRRLCGRLGGLVDGEETWFMFRGLGGFLGDLVDIQETLWTIRRLLVDFRRFCGH